MKNIKLFTIIMLMPFLVLAQTVREKDLKVRKGISYYEERPFYGKTEKGRYRKGLFYGNIREGDAIVTYEKGIVKSYKLYNNIKNKNERYVIYDYQNVNLSKQIKRIQPAIYLEGSKNGVLYIDKKALNKEDSIKVKIGLLIQFKNKKIEYVEIPNLSLTSVEWWWFAGGYDAWGNLKNSYIKNKYLIDFGAISFSDYIIVDDKDNVINVKIYNRIIFLGKKK